MNHTKCEIVRRLQLYATLQFSWHRTFACLFSFTPNRADNCVWKKERWYKSFAGSRGYVGWKSTRKVNIHQFDTWPWGQGQGHWPKNAYLGIIYLAINQEGNYTSFCYFTLTFSLLHLFLSHSFTQLYLFFDFACVRLGLIFTGEIFQIFASMLVSSVCLWVWGLVTGEIVGSSVQDPLPLRAKVCFSMDWFSRKVKYKIKRGWPSQKCWENFLQTLIQNGRHPQSWKLVASIFKTPL